jgi:hypothetical protein
MSIVEVLIPGIPGPPGEAVSITGPAVIGRESGTGAGGAIAVGAGLSISGGTLSAAATDLAYDPATRILSSSTGADETLPLADLTHPGLLSAAEKALIASALQPGQAIPSDVDCRNNSGAVLTIGTPVYETGSSGTRPTVAAADASSEITAANTLGLIVATVADNNDCQVRTHGILAGVNTSTLTEGAAIWLSEVAGQLTSTRPTQPAHGVFMGFCIKQAPGTAGILYINVINGQELNELHDVLITGPAPSAGAPRPVLAWSTDGLWHDVVLDPADVGADAAGSAAAAVAAHAAAVDPHSQYTTAAEAAAAAPVQSVAGRYGNVTLSAGDIGGLAAVATSGGYGDLSGRPTLGTAAATDASAYATAAQGAKADSAVQGAAGTSGQLQWNSSGAFAGVPSSSVDGATGAVSLARLVATANAAASLPPLSATGAWFTGGTSTTTKPHVLIEPAGTSSTAWSTFGTGWGVNAPPGFLGNLFDAQVNGTRAFAVDYLGNITMRNGAVQLTTPDNFSWSVRYGSTHTLGVTSNFVGLAAAASFGWSSNANGWAAQDISLWRDASDTLGMRRGTNPQSLRIYGTFTNSANFLRAAVNATSTEVAIGVERQGTAAENAPLILSGAGTGTVRLGSPGELAASSTVAALPASPAVGTFARVTDALAPAVGAVVVGGGSSQAIVWWDGANWRVFGGQLPTAAQIGAAPAEDSIVIPLTGEAANLTVSTLLTVPWWPEARTLTSLPVWMVNAAPAGSVAQFDIRVGGTSIFSTLPTIDATEQNSTTAAIAGVFSAAFVAAGQLIAQGSSVAFLCTQIGSSTAGAGAKVALPSRRV